MNEEKIEELKESLREVMMIIAERNQPISQDLKAMLVQVMDHVANRIQELRTMIAQQLPELEKGYPSSNVHSFGYDEKNGKLLVKFQGDYPQENGSVYSYSNVPKVIFDLFRKGSVPARTKGHNSWGSWFVGKVPSIGASLFTLIKGGGFPYQKLT